MDEWFSQIVDVSVSIGLTIPSGARRVLVQAEGQDVRYRLDGVAPTATVGFVLPADGRPRELTGALDLLRFIEVSPGALLDVQFV